MLVFHNRTKVFLVYVDRSGMKKLILLVVLLSGCASSSLVQRRNDPRGGIVSYKNGRLSAEGSRELAMNNMEEFCGGDYRINSETSAQEVVGATYNNGSATLNKRNIMYIDFTCK